MNIDMMYNENRPGTFAISPAGIGAERHQRMHTIDSIVQSIPLALSIRSSHGDESATMKTKNGRSHEDSGAALSKDPAASPATSPADCSSSSTVEDKLREELRRVRADAAAKEALLSRVTSERDAQWRSTEKLRGQLLSVRDQMNEENEALRRENAKLAEEARLAREENKRVAVDARAMISVIEGLRERIRVMEEEERVRQSQTRGGTRPMTPSFVSSSRHVAAATEDKLCLDCEARSSARVQHQHQRESAPSAARPRCHHAPRDQQKQPKQKPQIPPAEQRTQPRGRLQQRCRNSQEMAMGGSGGAAMIFSRPASPRHLEHSLSSSHLEQLVTRRPSLTGCIESPRKAQSDWELGYNQGAKRLQASCISLVSDSDLAQYPR